MDQRTLLGRLLSPAGFALVLIFFLLPFVTVSCGDGTTTMDATFSGVSMAVGTAPTADSKDTDPGTAAELGQLIMDETDLEPLALLAAVAVFAGIAVGVVRRRRIRFGASAGLAVAAVVLVVGAILRVPGHVADFVTKVAGSDDLPDGFTTATHTRYGFWLALVTLVGLAGANGFALLKAQGDDDRPPPPEPADVYLPLDELADDDPVGGLFDDELPDDRLSEDDVLADELTEQEHATHERAVAERAAQARAD